MTNMKQLLKANIIALTAFLLLPFAFSKEIYLTDQTMAKMSLNSSSSRLNQIKGQMLESQFRKNSYLDNFEVKAIGRGTYSETKELAANNFAPVYSPTKTWQAGLEKSTLYGAKFKASLGANILSTNSPTFPARQAYSSAVVGVDVDIWKNLFGKVSRARLQSLEIKQKQQQLQTKIDKKIFTLNARRLYWNLVAIEQSIKISEKLLKTSQSQYKLSQRRLKQSIGDKGIVARYASQVYSRQSDITVLRYQKEKVIKELQNLVPELMDKTILVKEPSFDTAVDSILECTTIISQQKSAPLNFTYYDEIVDLLKKDFQKTQLITETYDDPDIIFSGSLQAKGIKDNTSDAFDDSFDNDRNGFSTSLGITIPLGSRKKQKSTQQEYQKLYHIAQKDKWDRDLVNTHNNLNKSIKFLLESVRTQSLNNKNLKIRLNSMEKKFKQARISASDLIQDQDSLLASDLGLVNIKLEIVNTIFNYFSLYTETPCSFNQI